MMIPDPIERMERRIDTLVNEFIDESTCMVCKKTVDYDLICMSPVGDGPAVCFECSGLDESVFN